MILSFATADNHSHNHHSLTNRLHTVLLLGGMIGLLAASIWCWAIIVDKTLLFSRTKRDMDRFEEIFWSGQSLEELYRSLSAKPTHSMAALFVAAMREVEQGYRDAGRELTLEEWRREPAKATFLDGVARLTSALN